MIQVTPLLVTYNEAPNIVRTLQSLRWAEQVVIIDSFSSDETLNLARRGHPNIIVVQRRFDSFAGQCNFGLTHVTTPWVLSLDADYVLSPGLISAITGLTPKQEVSGYSIGFRYFIFGRPLRSTIYPARIVLYRRELAHYEDEGHGHRVRVTGILDTLRERIDHDDRKSLTRWLDSQDRYATIEAKHLLTKQWSELGRQDRLRLLIYFAPFAMFVYLLFGRRLILDGWRGWYYVCQRTIAEMLLSLRLLIEKHGLEKTETLKG